MIKLTITKMVTNPDYESEMSRYGPVGNPSREIEVEILKVELTEEEYKAVKKGVLEVIE